MTMRSIVTRSVAAVLIAGTTAGTALAYTTADVSPAAPYGAIAINSADHSLREVAQILAGLTPTQVADLVERCDVVNGNPSVYADNDVIFCHRVLVSEGVLPITDDAVTENMAGSAYDDNDADPVDDNDAL